MKLLVVSMSLAMSMLTTILCQSTDLTRFRYHVPAHIQEHIDYVTPGTKLFHLKKLDKIHDTVENLEKRNDFRLPPIINPAGNTSGIDMDVM
jgi:hypothetical protein